MSVNTFLRDLNGELKGNSSVGMIAGAGAEEDGVYAEDGRSGSVVEDDKGGADAVGTTERDDGKTGREGGGKGVGSLANFVAVMFDKDRESCLALVRNPNECGLIDRYSLPRPIRPFLDIRPRKQDPPPPSRIPASVHSGLDRSEGPGRAG